MSGNHHQQIFGQPDYANRPASGNLSGSDHLDMLNAADFYEDRTFSTQHLQPLQIPLRDGYRSDQHRLYTAHSNSVPRTGERRSLFRCFLFDNTKLRIYLHLLMFLHLILCDFYPPLPFCSSRLPNADDDYSQNDGVTVSRDRTYLPNVCRFVVLDVHDAPENCNKPLTLR